MFVTFCEITLAFLAVYGGYCLLIKLIYFLFCSEKDKICLAYRIVGEKINFSEIIFAKKAFLGRTRVIILLECEKGKDALSEMSDNIDGIDVYFAERIKKDERRFHRYGE